MPIWLEWNLLSSLSFRLLLETGENVVRTFLLILVFGFGLSAHAGPFEACLDQVKRTEHRLTRLESLQSCFEKNKDLISETTCYAAIKKIQIHEKSIELAEKLNSICFYDTSRFKNINACLQKISVFQIANNHDEAVFDCYRQFQTKLSQKECLKVSEKLKYPAKKEYLQNHCYSNAAQ